MSALTRVTTTEGAAPTPPPPESDVAPVIAASWQAVLAGVREGVLVADRGGVVRAANEAARTLLPAVTVGEVVDVAGCADLARVVHAGADEPEQELTVENGGADARRVRARGRALDDGEHVCWYLLDATDEYRRADSLLAAQDRARFLADAGRALHGVLHLDRTMRSVAEIAVPRLGKAALVLLADGGDAVSWARADAGCGRAATGRLSTSELRWAPRLHAILTGNAPADDWAATEAADLDLWAPGTEPGHVVAVSLPATGVVRAVLVLAHPADHDTDLADAYASRAGAALASAALFREQSHLGTVLQDTLSPPVLPECDGLVLGEAYRPARETLRVGGDFYEVIAPRDFAQGTSFLLGDVCGKGIDAAVLSGRVRQSLHALRLLERRPVRLLELLNTALLDEAAVHDETPRFATMVLGEARTGPDGSVTLEIATGGHPPPLVLRTDGTVETVEVSGTLVGALRGARFGAAEVVLRPGETCLLYSDGVTEARGPEGFYGEERLESALATCVGAPAPVICERVMQLLVSWLDGRDHDDVALLALQAATTVGET